MIKFGTRKEVMGFWNTARVESRDRHPIETKKMQLVLQKISYWYQISWIIWPSIYVFTSLLLMIQRKIPTILYIFFASWIGNVYWNKIFCFKYFIWMDHELQQINLFKIRMRYILNILIQIQLFFLGLCIDEIVSN